jgi:heterodisulfide reductase subunit A2
MSGNGSKPKIGAVMVVGGGISGMQAALDLANSGFKVYIVEENPSIGGRMAQLDKTFPTNDCSMCMISPKLIEVGKHLNIELLTYSKVESIDGEEGNLTVKVLKKARMVDMSKCTGCGTCQEKCPTKTDSEFDMGLAKRKSIFSPFPQAIPNIPVIDTAKCVYFLKGKCKACEKFCLTEAIDFEQKDEIVEIQVGSIIAAPGFKPYDPNFVEGDYGYNRMANVITSLEFERILSASGPFQGQVMRPSDGQHPVKVAWIQCVGSRKPEICKDYCSSVCCMYATKQAIIAREHDEKIKPSIFYMDIRAFGKGFERYYQSAKEKFGVEYIKAMPTPMVREKDNGNIVLEYTDDSGVKTYAEYDMVVLSVGLEPSAGTKELAQTLDVELDKFGFCKTEELKPGQTSRTGVYASGVFSAPMDIPESVQNASSAAFLASQPIVEARGTLVSEKQYPQEKDFSGEEPRIGVFVCRCGTNIARVVDVPAMAEYAKTLPNVVYADEAIYACSTDTQAKITNLIEEHGLNRMVVASCSPRTHEPLFQDTCREAGMNKYLFEMANIRDQCSWVHATHMPEANDKARDLVRMAVARAATLEPLRESQAPLTRTGLVIGGGVAGMTAALGLAAQGFETVLVERQAEFGGNMRDIYYTHEKDSDPQAVLAELIQQIEQEPKLTVYLNAELKNISGYVGNYQSTIKTQNGNVEYEHGVVIVATGGSEYHPEGEYLFGESDKVVTQHKLEEKIAKKEINASALNSVVMIQCVGSREDPNMYCSRVCCTHAVKNALRLKESNPDLNIYVLYRDMRTFAMKELVYEEARRQGVIFIKYDVNQKPEVTEVDGKLKIKTFDPVLDEELMIPADLLVLSAAIRPQSDAAVLGSRLKVPLNQDSFFMEAHMKLRPLDFVNEGMFMCGLAHAPKFVSESISQARGAVSRAVTILSQPYLMTGGVVSEVDEDKCVACLTCVRACPFGVPKFGDRNAVVIEAAACQGCGICASVCPRKAINVMNYKDNQIAAKSAVLCLD